MSSTLHLPIQNDRGHCEVFIIEADDVATHEEMAEIDTFLRATLKLFPSLSYRGIESEMGYFLGSSLYPIESEYIRKQFIAILGRNVTVTVANATVLSA